MNLAAKYRPTEFSEVSEQSAVVDILKKICSEKELTNRNFLFIGPAGTGKAQPLYSKVLTPKGFITMGEVEVGTEVITDTGATAKVSGIYPQGVRPIYEIVLEDGAKIRVSDEHLNLVHLYSFAIEKDSHIVLNTLDLLNLLEHPDEYSLYIDSPTNVPLPSELPAMRQIVRIEYIGDEECQCIMVDHPDHTYISDNYIPTHNTTLGRIISRHLNNGSTSGVIEIDAASHSGADAARDITNQARAYPVGTAWKCFLIDECHSISSQGWQVLLKTLEENPAKSIFILCVDKDGLVNTDHGLKRIQDVVISDKVWDGHTYRTVLGTYDKGVQSAIRVQFTSGNTVQCTPTHKFKVLSGDSEVWKPASDIRPGDVLLRYNNIDTSNWRVDNISDEEAFFIGYLTGNGNYDSHSMHLYTPYHKWNRLETILDTLVSQGVIRDYIKDSIPESAGNMYVTRIHFPTGQMGAWYTKVGADSTYKRGTKSIPAAVFKFSTNQFKAFVDGWYFADGCGRFDTFFTYKYGIGGYTPYLYCSNRRMITDLFHLLESHGYCPSLRTSVSKGEYTPGRSLPDKEVTSFILYLMHKPGYFHNAEFREKLQNIYADMPIGKYKYDLSNLNIPNRRISPTMLNEAGYSHFNDCGYFDTVSAVTECEPCHVYDIEVETSHSFIYNGICAHNCTTNPEKIPATILSRVQTFRLSKISIDGITQRLKHICDSEIAEGVDLKYEEDALRYIAKLGNGGMRDSIQLLDRAIAYSKEVTVDNLATALDLPNYDTYFELLNGVAKKDNTAIVKIINDVYDSGTNFVRWFEGFHSFVCQIVKYIYLQDITKTMIPAYYQDKISKYGATHAVLCLRLANTLITLNHSLKSTNYLQEVAITYLCSSAKR